jgi:hypothetical protein
VQYAKPKDILFILTRGFRFVVSFLWRLFHLLRIIDIYYILHEVAWLERAPPPPKKLSDLPWDFQLVNAT